MPFLVYRDDQLVGNVNIPVLDARCAMAEPEDLAAIIAERFSAKPGERVEWVDAPTAAAAKLYTAPTSPEREQQMQGLAAAKAAARAKLEKIDPSLEDVVEYLRWRDGIVPGGGA